MISFPHDAISSTAVNAASMERDWTAQGAAISSCSRRREAALRQYQHCVDALKRELAEIWGLFTWAAA